MDKLCITLFILIKFKEIYTSIEKLLLSLYFACVKLYKYVLLVDIYVIYKTNLIKYMLSKPFIGGYISK